MPDPEMVQTMLEAARVVEGNQQKLARTWLAIRELMGAPYTAQIDPVFLELWDRALSAWSSHAAWYGMHAHLYLGHVAALGSLLEIRRKGSPDTRAADRIGHTTALNGALASCYYSLSKLAPSAHASSFLSRSRGYVEAGLRTEPPAVQSGLYAIRGSIFLRQRSPQKAIADYESALKLVPPASGSEARTGEYLAELGWAEIHALHFREGIRHLREGVELLKKHHDPEFVVRGLEKRAYALACAVRLPSAFQDLRDARQLAVRHQLDRRLRSLPMRVVGKVTEMLSAVDTPDDQDASS